MKTTRWPLLTPSESGELLRRQDLHSAWGKVLGRIRWELFVTLTFDPKRVFPLNSERAMREARKWCDHASWMYRRPLGWACAPERGKSGHWHAHVLLIGVPAVNGTPSLLQEAQSVWRVRNGFIAVERVTGVSGIAMYTSKEAAVTGEMVVSDNIGEYRSALADTETVKLHL